MHSQDLFSDTLQGPDEPIASTSKKISQPLAERLRPKRIEDVVGQRHLLAEGQPLRAAFDEGRPHSMILWGPPGVGKTTLARLMADAFQLPFITISAVLAGVKDIREAVDVARKTRQTTGKSTVVFVDEVHRFSKAQQDAFLPHVESGLFVFIGATTENPSFEVNSALLSRSAVYVLKGLDDDDLNALLVKAQAMAYPQLHLTPEAKSILFSTSDGDARRFLNAVELVGNLANDQHLGTIDADLLRKVLPTTLRRFDKGGDNFYDLISALHKSVRGSNPDAALYWMCRMLEGGCDPLYIVRRVVRMAWEDIGIADPRAADIALAAANTYERLGSPEGELALANAVVYLCIAPKSNSIYKAYNAARSFVKYDKTRPVPMHLRNAPTKLMSDLGYSVGYRYPHDEPEGYAAAEQYMPEGLEQLHWYDPVERGLEIKIAQKLDHLHNLDQEALARGIGRSKEGSQS